MYLIYFDESGNTGNDLANVSQPVFVLAALIVPEEKWLVVEADLAMVLDRYFPPPREALFEIHATALRNGQDLFRGIPVATRLAFQADWLAVARQHGLKLIYRAIVKSEYHAWLLNTFGSGVSINPHVVAFALVSQAVNKYLKSLSGTALGVFISDENKEIVKDIDKSVRVLRGIEGTLRLDRIVEKGFFIESAGSLLLQLCDLCAYSARKRAEQKRGLPAKSIDTAGIAAIEPILHQEDQAFWDVLQWITAQQKKERPGASPRVGE